MSNLLEQIFTCLLIAGLIGLIIGWFIGKIKHKNELHKAQNELKLKLNKNNDIWDRKVSNIKAEYHRKLDSEKSKIELEKENLEERIKTLVNEQNKKNIQINHLKEKIILAKAETKRVEKKLKDEFQETMKENKSRVSTLLSKIDVRNNKELDDLIQSLVALEGNAIKEEAELRYKLNDTTKSFENKIANLKREVEELRSRIYKLINAKKINISIG